jgi:predicted RNA-binding protein with EMAP domain
MEILVPISIGELYDKITILEIKMEKIKDVVKLTNISYEHSLLMKIFNKLELHQLGEMMKLKTINEKLWTIEDKIRIEEKNKDWGEDFIQLARQVYFLNDQRAIVKKTINNLHGSNITEEKSYEKY